MKVLKVLHPGEDHLWRCKWSCWTVSSLSVSRGRCSIMPDGREPVTPSSSSSRWSSWSPGWSSSLSGEKSEIRERDVNKGDGQCVKVDRVTGWSTVPGFILWNSFCHFLDIISSTGCWWSCCCCTSSGHCSSCVWSLNSCLVKWVHLKM